VLTASNKVEYAVVKFKTGPHAGKRCIVSGNEHGIMFGENEIEYIYMHSHPTNAGASGEDYLSLYKLDQSQQTIIEPDGNVKIRQPKANEEGNLVTEKGEVLKPGETVTKEGPVVVEAPEPVFKSLDPDGGIVYNKNGKQYRSLNGQYEKWDGAKWVKMEGMDQAVFEAMLGESVDNIKFKGTAEEIRQQGLVHDSKTANTPYKPNEKHNPHSKDYGGPKASVEPHNALELWSKRNYYDGKYWWTLEKKGKDIVYTRFSPDNTGGFHYSGSSNGVNNKGDHVPLDIPPDVVNFANGKS
jgi:hypothetical protein